MFLGGGGRGGEDGGEGGGTGEHSREKRRGGVGEGEFFSSLDEEERPTAYEEDIPAV